jgi:hypothetical protein
VIFQKGIINENIKLHLPSPITCNIYSLKTTRRTNICSKNVSPYRNALEKIIARNNEG